MLLSERLLEIGQTLPAPFHLQKDQTLLLEYVVAERSWLLSKKKVSYRCRVRVDDAGKTVRMFERLKESAFGLFGGVDDVGPGASFKKETFRSSGTEREGVIDEQARLFAKRYKCRFDFSEIRNAVKKAAADAGYAFSMCLAENSV